MRIGEGDLAGATSWVEKASILVLAEDRRQIGILDGGSFCRRFCAIVSTARSQVRGLSEQFIVPVGLRRPDYPDIWPLGFRFRWFRQKGV